MLSSKSKYEKYKPKKRYGQNFLVDDNIARKIVKSLEISEKDTVIEIGPGQGALTKHLINETKRFIAVEIDTKVSEDLKNKGYNVAVKDFLQFDFEEDIQKELRGTDLKVIGNIPYNITSGILFKLLDSKIKINSCVIMIQREVAERLVASVNTKQYGILAVQFQAMAKVNQLFNVPPTAFFPKPDVTSSVIRITFCENENRINNISVFKEFVRSAFSKRRKTLKNSLNDFFEKYELNINDYGFDFSRRAESLTVKEFIDLSNITAQKIKLD